ncbi:hypothetical protein BV898_08579 [Hypsibius exemplaris]|uniref:Uncharacterized protein n=1 Tax=Hypsibius exemplaris TaxID=2072580 RepID=A0A1W0WQ48_HYPEX|nr:hypothetical protein BV898_08579 [Hypsibius exemplaris]
MCICACAIVVPDSESVAVSYCRLSLRLSNAGKGGHGFQRTEDEQSPRGSEPMAVDVPANPDEMNRARVLQAAFIWNTRETAESEGGREGGGWCNDYAKGYPADFAPVLDQTFPEFFPKGTLPKSPQPRLSVHQPSATKAELAPLKRTDIAPVRLTMSSVGHIHHLTETLKPSDAVADSSLISYPSPSTTRCGRQRLGQIFQGMGN